MFARAWFKFIKELSADWSSVTFLLSKNSILFFIEKGDSYAKGLHQKITDTKEQEKILNFLNNQNEFIVFVKMNTRGLNKNQLKKESANRERIGWVTFCVSGSIRKHNISDTKIRV